MQLEFDWNKLTAEEWLSRGSDPPTSKRAGKKVVERAPSQAQLLLKEYALAGADGLTAEQAGELSGLAQRRSCCYWKRCGELLKAGLVEDTGLTRVSSAGEQQRVCRITAEGLSANGR